MQTTSNVRDGAIGVARALPGPAANKMITVADPVSHQLVAPNDATVQAMARNGAGVAFAVTVLSDSCLGCADGHGDFVGGGGHVVSKL